MIGNTNFRKVAFKNLSCQPEGKPIKDLQEPSKIAPNKGAPFLPATPIAASKADEKKNRHSPS